MTRLSARLVLTVFAALAASVGCAGSPTRARPEPDVADVAPPPAPPSAPGAPAAAAPAPAPIAAPTTAPLAPEIPGLPSGLPGDRVPAFRTTVRRPDGAAVREETFDSRAAGRPVVYIVTSTTCPYCREYVERMKGLETRWGPRGVDVVHVYPNRGETVAQKVEWHAQKGFRGGQILDANASIARSLAADHTPTAYVVDKAGVIAYRGAIDDSPSGREIAVNYVDAALEAVLAGKPVGVEQTDPPG